jgi:cathepsin B
MGTIVDPDWTITMAPKNSPMVVSDDLPESFDARTAWPECESVINHVRDQSNCGSCWAHGTTEALNDRICIASGGAFTTLLSVSDTTACCNFVQCQSMGCNGGQVGSPWNWFQKKGVATGGDFGSTGTCYNYTMDQCAHHVTDPSLKSCDDIVQVSPTCSKTCPDDSTRTYGDDKHFSTSSYNVRGVEDIKADIQKYGTVTSAFTVYEDFLTYKSGVYQHTTGSALGGHAIKTIGWGTENGEDYWLCVNSWNNTWGDMGTFKILMGDCGINRQMHAGLPG